MKNKILNKKKIFKALFFTTAFLFAAAFFYFFLFGERGNMFELSSKGGGYDLSHPEKSLTLPNELKEISGLSYLNDNILLGICDEWGVIRTIDAGTGSVTGEYRFAKQGNFEGITTSGDRIYVLRNDGRIFDVRDMGLPAQYDVKYSTPFTANNNLEGICYYEKEGGLLLACKGSTFVFKNMTPGADERFFYIFDLTSNKLRPEPAFILNFAAVRKQTGLELTAAVFQPSGIAVHPLSGDIFIISSTARMMLILDSEGNFKEAVSLRREVFKQPEGICFSPSGTLFISNEGRRGKGNILIFSYSPSASLTSNQG